MATLREIKRRIRSISNTSKVTHAMELVAATKMRKSQQEAIAGRPYTNTLQQIITSLRGQTSQLAHQLLVKTRLVSQMIILISTDRGLVGGLNLNVFREITKFNQAQIKFVVVGKKGTQFSLRSGTKVIASFAADEQPFLDLARTLSRLCVASFITGEVGSVFVVYPRFESTARQIPVVERILPIELESATIANGQDDKTEILFEPSADLILESILPHHILTHLYQILLEAKASEHSARMVAMKNATDAATDLVSDLTLTYNQARQEAITKELLDMVTAQAAFE